MNPGSGFPAAAASADLGVPGYTFADLHDPERLASSMRPFLRGRGGGRSWVVGPVGRVAQGPRRAADAAGAVAPLDYWHLVEVQHLEPALPEAMLGPDWRLRRRDGFKLTDARMNPHEALSEIHYCVLCHECDKDSCSKGLYEHGSEPGSGHVGKVAVNPLGIELSGCPLDEKISEMHVLRNLAMRSARSRL